MKEKVLETLAYLGFKVEAVEGLGHVFEYEGMTLVYFSNEDDENFLELCAPNVYKCDGGRWDTYYALIEKINSKMKYVKAYTLAESMCVAYERELIGDEDLKTILSRMIVCLETNMGYVRQIIGEIEDAQSHGDDDTDNIADNDDDATDNN